MNIIYSEKRSRIAVSNVFNLMKTILTGLPLEFWDPTYSVKTWLIKRHTADDTRVLAAWSSG